MPGRPARNTARKIRRGFSSASAFINQASPAERLERQIPAEPPRACTSSRN
jgi:hypothetical protein